MSNSLLTKIVALSNTVKNLIALKANKTDGVNEITDTNSSNYSNISNMSSGATQGSINDAINIQLGQCVKTSLTNGLIKNDGTIDQNVYLNANQGSSNSNKYLKVQNDGSVVPETLIVPQSITLVDSITDGDTSHAVTPNAVYDYVNSIISEYEEDLLS